MQNPGTAYRFKTVRPPSQRYTSIAIVGLIHIAAIYALASGLAVKIVKQAQGEIETRVIDVDQPPPPEPMPTPTNPAMEMPTVDTIPEPVVKIDASQANPVHVAPAPTAPAVSDAVASGLMATHSTPPYPPIARRLGHQGRVTLQLSIGADGRVLRADVVRSSGWPELDQAAIEWVTSRWRYRPALHGGVAAASTAMAAVKFDLRSAN